MPTDLRTRLLHVLIDSTPPQYLPPPNDLSRILDAVIAELGRSCEKPTPVRGLSVRKAAAEAAVAASRQLGVPVDQRLVDLSLEPYETEKED